MQETNNDYSFSLFKPLSKYGKSNRNLIIILVSVWFVAIFGFQVLLLIFQKPTPEQALIDFNSVASKVQSGAATHEDLQVFVNSTLMVSGKSMVKPHDKAAVDKALSWAVYSMLSDSVVNVVTGNVAALKEVRAAMATAKDAEFIALQKKQNELKNAINLAVLPVTGADVTGLKPELMPYALVAENTGLSESDWAALQHSMNFYLTHYQSFLTDTRFLGFPFHYFYSSEFLLFLFVGICLFYSIRINQLQKKYAVQE